MYSSGAVAGVRNSNKVTASFFLNSIMPAFVVSRYLKRAGMKGELIIGYIRSWMLNKCDVICGQAVANWMDYVSKISLNFRTRSIISTTITVHVIIQYIYILGHPVQE
jgi:hypothetical protein